MKKIVFCVENIKKVEVFLGAVLESYYQIGKPCGTFKFPKEEGQSSYDQKELKLLDGQVLYKNKSGEIFLKVN